MTVVPNGVDLEFYRPGVVPPWPRHGRHALVFTGKMDYRPNVDAVLWFADAVLPLILAQAPGCPFLCRGAAAARSAGTRWPSIPPSP